MPAISIPAPIGGWNASDALDKMPATDAVKLQNLIPRPTYVESRKGYQPHVTGLGGSVETLAAYTGTTIKKLIAAANGKFFNVTTSPAVELATGFTANEWNYTQHTGRLIFCNGSNTPQVFDGTTIAAASYAGSPGGLDPTKLWGTNTHHGRVFYWYKTGQSFWYAAAASFQGVLAEFNLATQLQTGGTLVQMVTWTLDSGNGIDDLAVFIFSTGEALVYQGADPGSVNDWSLIGRFQIGEPMGPRAHAKVAGTEIIITRDGYVDLSAALKDGRYSEQSIYSSKIIRASKSVTNQFSNFTGWQALLYPAGNLFIVNIPTGTASAYQHARETSSGGWCEFIGWNARCFAIFDNKLYFGDSGGKVHRADFSQSDDGARILAHGIPAFNPLGSRAQKKQLTAVSVVSNWPRAASLAYDGLADFNTELRSTIVDDTGSPSAIWDLAEWDTSSWGIQPETLPIYPAWKNCSATGYTITLSVRLNQRAFPLIWYATNMQYRNAGAL